MTDAVATLQDRLDTVPIHGREGRIRSVRLLLGMTQMEFCKAIGVGRETVSHWENVDEVGKPRQRATQQSARAITAVVKERLGVELRPDTFFTGDETLLDAVVREQRRIRELVSQAGGKAPAEGVISEHTHVNRKPHSSNGSPPVPDLYPALAGLLRELPARGRGWSQERRDAFLTMFEMAVDFTIPVDAKDA